MWYPLVEDPTDNRLVRDVYRCIRKEYAKEVKKSNTLSSVEVEKVILGVDFSNPIELKTAAFLLLQYNLMGRFSDVQLLRCGEISIIEGGHLIVKVVQAKNYEAYDAMTSFIVCNQAARMFLGGNHYKILGEEEWFAR